MKQTTPPPVRGGATPNREFRFDFMKHAGPFVVVSTLATIGAVVFMMIKGFNYGIDFAGGTEVQVKFNTAVESSQVRKFAEDMGLKNASVQAFGDQSEYLIRMETVEGATDKERNENLNKVIKNFTQGLDQSFAEQKAQILRVDTVGPQVGDELKRNGLLAAFYSIFMILIYIGLRFDYKYAPGAVLCLVHDCVITLGIFSLLNKEVNVQTMAAILTLIGYSLNDTIINYDRIRENEPLYRDKDMAWIINRSVNDVLTRTLLTNVTTLLAVGSLYVLAGGVIEDIAFTLAIGIVIGTYSSVYIASPLVLVIDRLQKKPAAT